MSKRQSVDKNSREYQLDRMARGRGTLLLIIIFTVVNLAFVLMDLGTYFLFSVSVPYYLVSYCMGLDNFFVDGPWDTIGSNTQMALVIGAVILIIYLLCWLLAKKHSGWMVAATVLFVVDSLALVWISFALLVRPMNNIVDFLMHIWALVQMIQACVAGGKLRRMDREEPGDPENF